MSYPQWIEQYWIEEARAHWGTASVEEIADRARAKVAALSDLFTTERPAVFPEYAACAESRLAYGLFFFPQTFARVRWILDESFRLAGFRFPQRDTPLRGLDLGAGAGAATFAALTFLSQFRWQWLAVERSTPHLEDLRRLATTGRPHLPEFVLDTRAGNLSDPLVGGDATWDLILISFALNEVTQQGESRTWTILSHWLARLSVGGLLIICEPASRGIAEFLERFRDMVASQRRARIVAPCWHAHPCPLLAERLFWCHEVRSWSPSPVAEMINRKLYRDLAHLKFTFLVLANEPPGVAIESSFACARLIAPVTAERGKLITRGCAADGQAYTYEMLTRYFSSEERVAAMRLERGARVQFLQPENTRSGVIRARGIKIWTGP